jgi:hypothetical protein
VKVDLTNAANKLYVPFRLYELLSGVEVVAAAECKPDEILLVDADGTVHRIRYLGFADGDGAINPEDCD